MTQAILTKFGSSPRVRGTDAPRIRVYGRNRFIPARAGNSRIAGRQNWLTAVHPRACGEQFCSHVSPAPFGGSSPRVRGTGRACAPLQIQLRFIPARAGNRSMACAVSSRIAVHPRACGEQYNVLKGSFVSPGSSPRVRGTDRQRRFVNRVNRFIPARAGNRWPGPAGSGHWAVHPRACGEQLAGSMTPPRGFGSSPRVRGTVVVFVGRAAKGRFIPARAGNRGEPIGWPRSAPVHPRACGEQSQSGTVTSVVFGSSPRVRGTGRASDVIEPVARFIPARAGNSSAGP